MAMFGQQKPLASLSATLLARKGQAKPAMRPQGFGGFGAMPGATADAQDDLGWNDMGYHATESVADAAPPVLIQRKALRQELSAPTRAPVTPQPTTDAPTMKPVSVATATRIGRETSKQHGKARPRSAFTLRLDQERHLRLRLASALHGTSAQMLVTEALDQFLQTRPEVEELIRQIPTRLARP